PRRPTELHSPTSSAVTAATAATTAPTAAMASPTVLTFDAEGRAVDFDVWVDDLQLFLQCDSRDGVSLFDHTSGVSTAPTATADNTVRSQWTTRDAVARLAIRRHLPPAERAHFGQYKTAQSLYDAVVACYSSPATAALSRLMLPYLFPDLAAFATVADLVAHLRTSDARYRAALPTDMFLTRQNMTGFTRASRPPSTDAYRSARCRSAHQGVPLTPISPLLLLLLLSTSLALRRSELRLPLVRDTATARVVEGAVGEAVEGVEEAEGVAVEVGVVLGVGASVAVVEVVEAVAEVVEAAAAVVEVAAAVVLVEVQPHNVEALVVASASSNRAPVRPRRPSSFISGTLGMGGLGVLVPAPTEALHTFTLDSGASRSFFRDSTTLTLLSRPVAVSLADPSGGPVLAHSSTVLPCTAAPSGLLSGLHLPSFSTNLVSGADLQDAWVAASSQVFSTASRSSVVSAPCSCRPLSHETLLWHHRLGHPSLPRLRGMASRTLVSGLPRSLPPLPPGPATTCVPCVEGRQRAAPHSSTFTLTKAPLQTLHMDVWGPARVRGQGHERYFLLVVDDYSRYTTIFPLRSKGEVPEVLIDWIRDRGAKWNADLAQDTSADKLSSRAVPCVFLGFPPDAPGWQFYHPTSRRVLSSQDVTFDESVDPAEPVEVAVDSGAARGAEPAGGGTGGAGTGGAEPERVELGGAESGGAKSGRAESGGAEPARAAPGGALGVPLRREPLSLQPLHEWYSRRCRGATGAAGDGATGAGAAGAAGGAAGAGAAGAAGGAAGGAGGATGAAGTGAAGAGGAAAAEAAGAAGGAAGAGAAGGAAGTGDPGAEGAGSVSAVSGGAARPRPYYIPLLQQVLGSSPSPGPPPPPVQSQSQLQPASPLPSPSPYSEPTRGLTERREPESRPVSPKSRSASPVRTVRAGHVSCLRPPLVPSTHSMNLRPSTAPQRVPLPSPPASSLPASPNPASDSLRAASPS
ncbi:unnamed protein product, partial [Closterium sp. NIES-53]